jgi:hypothetical protein
LPEFFVFSLKSVIIVTMSDIVTQIRTRFDHAAAKKTLQEKYESKMLFAHAGGMFKSTPEMISFLSLYNNEDIVLADVYHTPVKVNAAHLRDEMQKRWYEQMNAWLVEWSELQKQR